MIPKFDDIKAASVEIDLIKREMKITAAFVDTKTGHTHGWTHRSSWSKETWNQVQLLAKNAERELRVQHFQNAESSAVEEEPSPVGLGELLGSVPQA